MKKIQMQTPLVEMDGDEMTRILWKMIKDELLLPFIDLKTEYCDLYTFYLIFIKHCDKFIVRNRFLRSVSPFC